MKNRLYILIASIIALSISSCNMDHLYFAYGEKANVKILIDWSETNLTPNGVSAYIFDQITGNAITEVIVSGIPSEINIALAEGCYDILLINDTEFELNNVSFDGVSNIKQFVALINANAESKYNGLSTKINRGFASDCDDIACTIIENLFINKQDIEYYKEKPNVGELVISKIIEAKLKQITEVIDIEIIVENINSAAGAPRTHLTNIAGGYSFYDATKHQELVTHEFVLNNRVIYPDNYKLAKISKRLICFGPTASSEGSLDNKHQLIMNFILTNGDVHPVILDINDLIKSQHNGVQYIHTVKTTITLPVSIGDGDGAFNPDIEEWEDIEVGVPI